MTIEPERINELSQPEARPATPNELSAGMIPEPGVQSFGDTKINGGDLRPRLTLNELSENRLDDLQEIYRSKGLIFLGQDQLVSQIRKDWGMHVALANLEAQNQELSEYLEPIVVTIDGRDVSIFGAIHSWSSGSSYHQIFNETIAQFDSVIAEQGMGTYFKLPKGTISCADWGVIGSVEAFKIGFMTALDIRHSLALVGGLLFPFQRKADEATTGQASSLQNEIDGLPDQIAREIFVAEGGKLDFIERRSQYQAEFVKAWVSKHEGSCAVFVGGLHATEMRDYLKYGVDDSSISELARSHVEMIRNNSLSYSTTYAFEWARVTAVSVLGVTTGIAPWVGLAYGAGKLLIARLF